MNRILAFVAAMAVSLTTLAQDKVTFLTSWYAQAEHGGALASIGAAKQQRIVRAARHYLMRLASVPPCRFDAVAIDGGQIRWIRGAFDAG